MTEQSITQSVDLYDDDVTMMHYAMAMGAQRAFIQLATRDYLSAEMAAKIVAEAVEMKQDTDALRAGLETRISALQSDSLRRRADIIKGDE